ncbi:hypothetical protein D3C71_24570 [compost metagenome]
MVLTPRSVKTVKDALALQGLPALAVTRLKLLPWADLRLEVQSTARRVRWAIGLSEGAQAEHLVAEHYHADSWEVLLECIAELETLGVAGVLKLLDEPDQKGRQLTPSEQLRKTLHWPHDFDKGVNEWLAATAPVQNMRFVDTHQLLALHKAWHRVSQQVLRQPEYVWQALTGQFPPALTVVRTWAEEDDSKYPSTYKETDEAFLRGLADVEGRLLASNAFVGQDGPKTKVSRWMSVQEVEARLWGGPSHGISGIPLTVAMTLQVLQGSNARLKLLLSYDHFSPPFPVVTGVACEEAYLRPLLRAGAALSQLFELAPGVRAEIERDTWPVQSEHAWYHLYQSNWYEGGDARWFQKDAGSKRKRS